MTSRLYRLSLIGILAGFVLLLTGCPSPVVETRVPVTPSGLEQVESDTIGAIKLFWEDNSSNNDSYTVYRSDLESGTYVRIGTSNSGYYIDQGLNILAEYWYKVSAFAGSTESPACPPLKAQVPIPAPVNLMLAKSATALTLSWDPIEGATGYVVYKANSSYDPVFEKTGDVTAPSTSWDDTNASSKSYYYCVAAVIGTTEGKMSRSVSGSLDSLPAPEGFAVVAEYAGPSLSWNSVNGAQKYVVYRAQGSYYFPSYNKVKEIDAPATTWVDDSLGLPTTSGLALYYKVAAVRNGEVGLQSLSIQSYRKPLSAPTGLSASTVTATTGSGTAKRLSWTAVEGATGYDVYRDTSSYGDGTLIGSSTSTSYDDDSAPAMATCYYWVVPNIEIGTGIIKGSSSSKISTYVIGKPTLTSANDTGASITLSWDALPSASTVRIAIYRDSIRLGDVAAQSSSYTDKNVAIGTSHSYQIAQMDGNVEGQKSDSVSGTATGKVSNVSASLGRHKEIKVSWDSLGAANADSYNVYASNSRDSGFTLLGNVPDGASPNYIESGITKGTVRYYYVQAVKDGSELPQSNSVKGETFGAAPTGLTAKYISSGTYKITWDSSPGAMRYMITYITFGGDWDDPDDIYTLVDSSGSIFYPTASPVNVKSSVIPYEFQVNAISTATGNPFGDPETISFPSARVGYTF